MFQDVVCTHFGSAIASLALLSVPQQAPQSWVELEQVPALSSRSWFDQNSVTTDSHNANIRRAWFKLIYQEPQEAEGLRYVALSSHVQVDCQERSMRSVLETMLDARGNVVGRFASPADAPMMLVQSLTLAEAHLQRICEATPS